MTLPELLAKVEGASGPDREIDVAIYEMLCTRGLSPCTIPNDGRAGYPVDLSPGVSSGRLCAGWESLTATKAPPIQAPWDLIEPADDQAADETGR